MEAHLMNRDSRLSVMDDAQQVVNAVFMKNKTCV